MQACRQSLRRLGREHIDVYFLHWPDDTGVPLEETWGAMARTRRRGAGAGDRHVQLRDRRRRALSRASAGSTRSGRTEPDRLPRQSLAGIAQWGEAGIAVTIYEPLGSGIVTGRTIEQVSAQSRRALAASPPSTSDCSAQATGEKELRGRRRRAADRRNAWIRQLRRSRSRGCCISPASRRRSRGVAATVTRVRTRRRRPARVARRCPR